MLGVTGRKVCPVATFLSYMANPRPAGSSAPGPFFVFSDGRALTRERFVKELRAVLKAGGFMEDDYAGCHSFRIGAATTAASHGMPDSVLQSSIQCTCTHRDTEELVGYKSLEDSTSGQQSHSCKSDQLLYPYTSDLQALEACSNNLKITLPTSTTSIESRSMAGSSAETPGQPIHLHWYPSRLPDWF